MTKLHNKNILTERRKKLRKNATFEENLLWKLMRKFLPEFQFRRQYSVGPYILDFYSIAFRVCIELDGEHHRDNVQYDRERDNYLRSCNIRVLRFWNYQVRDSMGDVVCHIRSFK
jgi:very-short-patch-repair endonuclease